MMQKALAIAAAALSAAAFGGEMSVLFRNGRAMGDVPVAIYRIPALAAWPDGSLIAVSDARHDNAGDLEEGQRISVVCRLSADGGKSWSSPAFVWRGVWTESEKWSGGDPALIVDRNTGRVFCFINALHRRGGEKRFCHLVLHSDDKGRTWSGPRDVTDAIRRRHWPGSKTSLVSGGHGIQLRDGTLVYTVICSNEVGLFASSDHGRSWRIMGNVAHGASECKVAELPDGTLVVNARVNDRKGGRHVHVSHDRGATWRSRLDLQPADPGCNAGLDVLSVGGKKLLAFVNCDSWGARNNVTLRLSGDGGSTWSAGLRIDPQDGGYSDVVPLPDGAAGIVWERLDSGLTCFTRISPDTLAKEAASRFAPRNAEPWASCTTQRLEVVYAHESAPSGRMPQIAEMPFGKKYAFSTRWDDANPRHADMAATLNPLGVFSTFYIDRRPDGAFNAMLRRLVEKGNSIGSHSISHAYMQRLVPAVAFREVLENRIVLEVGSQSPVSTFVLPYSSARSAVDAFSEVRLGEALANAGFVGGADSQCDTAVRFGLPPNRWCGSYTFRANDYDPSRKEFCSRFSRGLSLSDRRKLPCGPHLTLGVHAWQTDEGMKRLGEIVGEVADRADLWQVNENTYAAHRMQCLNSRILRGGTVRKTKEGHEVAYRIVRPAPHTIGAAVDLFLELPEKPVSVRLDGRTVAASKALVLPPAGDMPTKFVRLDGGLSVNGGEDEFRIEFTNPMDHDLSQVELSLRLPPGYRPGVARASRSAVRAGEKVSLSWKVSRPSGPEMTAGKLFAAAEIDAVAGGERVRMWMTMLKNRRFAKGNSPRDHGLCVGPVSAENVPAATAAALSVPGAAFHDVGGGEFGRWREVSPNDSEMPFAVQSVVPSMMREVTALLKSAAEDQFMIAVFDFFADAASGGRCWRMKFGASRVADADVEAFLNGRRFASASGVFTPQAGVNRLVFRFPVRHPHSVLQELSVVSVPDAVSARFVTPQGGVSAGKAE